MKIATMKIAIAFLALSLGACTRPGFTSGERCTLNTDCAEPLVCQLDRCRRQCIDSRDCGAGLRCLALGTLGGVCQLPAETECTLSSDCPTGLVCRFATCTTECVSDRDCAPGATCALSAGSVERGCIDPITNNCIYNSDCPPGLVCGADQLCHVECNEPRDCVPPRTCVANRCTLDYDGG